MLTAVMSAQSADSFREFMKLDSDELLKRGSEYEKKESMDTALVLYSIVSKRTYDTKNKDEIKKCCDAYMRKTMIYFSYFFDYTKAYENLISAMELKNNENIDIPHVDNTAAIFYHVIAVTCRNWEMERMAMNYCLDAYNGELKRNDREGMDINVCNMIVMSCNLNESKILDELWDSYVDEKETSFIYRFNLIFYKYLKFLNAKQYNNAIEEAEKMLSLSKDTEHRRHIIISYNSIVAAHEKNGNYETALSYIEKEEKLINKWNLRDIAIEILNTKENIYRKLGETRLADVCSRMYYQKKDSLLNLTQMTNICRTQYNGESRKMEKEIAEITIENKIYNKVVIIILFFVFMLIAMVVMLYVKIKQLRKSNITIYENNEEYFKHEEKERLKLKHEVETLEKTSGNSSVQLSEDTVNKVSDVQTKDEENEGYELNNECEKNVQDSCTVDEDDKYKKNFFSDEEKKKILDKVLTVMENTDEICSESFSGSRLAELTGYKYNYVSLVINENYGCNFNSLLNRFRIKEACRRLSDEENYGNYTIDTIANSLGFKSRTTLTTSFKKIIGLTPSQYRSIAKEKKSQNNAS